MVSNEFLKALGLDGKVALITGGGSGLGLAMAKCMANAGAQVVIAGRRKDVLEKACEEIGSNADYIEYDVTETQRAGEVVASIVQKYGKLDVLVNNAGVHCKKPIEDVTQENLQQVMGVHIFGAYALMQAAIPYMRERKQGSIILISSMSAYIGLTNVTAYSAAKGAVLGLIKTVSSEVAMDGIRVNAITPGFIDSPMFRQAVNDDIPRQKKILGHTPMNRYGDAEDIGWAAVYLASDAAKFVTGTSLVVDGGCSIGF